jgi:phenylpropionate dioxygenase-like ring-hydroxylating dioxygenase large terminal subunit
MTEFVLNTWYPIAWTRDIGRTLQPRRITGTNVVLYRTEAGAVAALEDVCPHRLLPLSMGRLKGDAVECGYHGMTFDCGGRCVRVPGQDSIPSSAKVRSYPTHEHMGLVWIWMGEPALADRSLVFDLPQYHDPAWSVGEGDALEIGCHYLNLADNLCDPSHVSFVHLTTLGNAHSEDIPVQYERQGDKMLTWRWIIDAPAIPLFAKYGNFKGHVDRWHYYHYHAPSIAIIDFGSADTGTGAPEGRRDNCIQIYACHFITPVDENTCIDHWLHVKNFKADDQLNTALSNEFRSAFREDKAILEAIHRNEQRLSDRRPIKLALDASPVHMRRLIDQLIRAEAPSPQAAA